MNELPLANQLAIVTGGSKGIGRAIAEIFAQNGARVVITARNHNDFTNKLSDYEAIEFFQMDVANKADVIKLFDYVKKAYGQLNILINNAAILIHKPFLDTSLDEWEDIININVQGAVTCSYHAFYMMKDNNTPSTIINISSLSGIPHVEKFPGTSAYVTSKYAISGLTDGLAEEGKAYNIRVNAIAPGAVETDMLKKGWPTLKTSTKPEDIAKIALFLADKRQSGCMTGNVIPVFCNDS